MEFYIIINHGILARFWGYPDRNPTPDLLSSAHICTPCDAAPPLTTDLSFVYRYFISNVY